MDNKPLRIVHLSDLHFSKVTFNPLQFFSKRWVGNFNLIFRRKKTLTTDHLPALLETLKERSIDVAMISGDLTTTSQPPEYALAKQFIHQLNAIGIETYTIPGNHDHYTRKACRDRLFYQFFPDSALPRSSNAFNYTLKEERIAIRPLNEHWWWLGLDTTIARPFDSAEGLFSTELEQALEEALAILPKEAQVVLVNHYPLLPTKKRQNGLDGRERLEALLQRHPQIKLYLHGHNHHQQILDLRGEGLPITCDSGSCVEKRKESCHLIELQEAQCRIEVLQWHDRWITSAAHDFTWK